MKVDVLNDGLMNADVLNVIFMDDVFLWCDLKLLKVRLCVLVVQKVIVLILCIIQFLFYKL